MKLTVIAAITAVTSRDIFLSMRGVKITVPTQCVTEITRLQSTTTTNQNCGVTNRADQMQMKLKEILSVGTEDQTKLLESIKANAIKRAQFLQL